MTTTEPMNPPLTVCPDRCDLPGHDWDFTEEGRLGRTHGRHLARIDPVGQVSPVDVDLSQDETDGLPLKPAWVELNHSDFLTVAEARRIAAALMAATDRLDQVNV
jgi:hypothetical protein